jgi:hypothetical protein
VPEGQQAKRALRASRFLSPVESGLQLTVSGKFEMIAQILKRALKWILL